MFLYFIEIKYKYIYVRRFCFVKCWNCVKQPLKTMLIRTERTISYFFFSRGYFAFCLKKPQVLKGKMKTNKKWYGNLYRIENCMFSSPYILMCCCYSGQHKNVPRRKKYTTRWHYIFCNYNTKYALYLS